jgi:helicase required for RNAi-mediated heterochromatin assembly 1
MCCDPCKCQYCNRNGIKGLIKAAPMGGAPSRKQLPYNPPPPTDNSGSTPNEWYAYASGGARIDDAEALKKMQEEDAKFLEDRGTPAGGPAATLVDISPVEVIASANVNLLLGPEFQSQPRAQSRPLPRVLMKEEFSYVDTAKKDKKSRPMPTSLLD